MVNFFRDDTREKFFFKRVTKTGLKIIITLIVRMSYVTRHTAGHPQDTPWTLCWTLWDKRIGKYRSNIVNKELTAPRCVRDAGTAGQLERYKILFSDSRFRSSGPQWSTRSRWSTWSTRSTISPDRFSYLP
jgi:hypothetical protein